MESLPGDEEGCVSAFYVLAMAVMAGSVMADNFSVMQSPGDATYVLCHTDCPERTVKMLDLPTPVSKAAAVTIAAQPVREPRVLVLQFGLASSSLGKNNRLKLDRFLSNVGSAARYSVVGSTDRIGGRAFNRLLATNRAKAAMHYLNRLGVPHQKFDIETRCCIDNPPAVNPDARRVVIRVIE